MRQADDEAFPHNKELVEPFRMIEPRVIDITVPDRIELNYATTVS